MSEPKKRGLLAMTAGVVAAYVRSSRVRPEELPTLLADVHEALRRAATGEAPEDRGRNVDAPRQKPAVPIKRSVAPDYIISLEDGRKYRSLTRHLMAQYGLTPAQYRAKWNLPPDYPMVAPNYSAERSRIAREARRKQLGRSGGQGGTRGN